MVVLITYSKVIYVWKDILYELDLFKLNTLCNRDVNTVDNFYNQRIHSRYFSPHSFKEQNKYVIENDDDSFSIFHNNLISLSKNLENLQSSILDELVFNFNVIGITETKINDSNSESAEFSLPGYEFEFVPTPLAFGGVGMFIDEKMVNYPSEKIWLWSHCTSFRTNSLGRGK